MEPRRDPGVVRFWPVAVGLSVLAAVVTWILVDMTTSVTSCQHAGALGVSDTGLVGLMVLTPVVTAVYGWRERVHWTRVAVATVVSAVLAIFLVSAATQLWWFGHGCYS